MLQNLIIISQKIAVSKIAWLAYLENVLEWACLWSINPLSPLCIWRKTLCHIDGQHYTICTVTTGPDTTRCNIVLSLPIHLFICRVVFFALFFHLFKHPANHLQSALFQMIVWLSTVLRKLKQSWKLDVLFIQYNNWTVVVEAGIIVSSQNSEGNNTVLHQ